MSKSVLISKDEAIAALEANAWSDMVATCGHTGCEDHRGRGPYRIHSFLGGFGADWDLAEAIELVHRADTVGWVGLTGREMFTMGHDLFALVADKTYFFDARRPPAVPA